MAQGLAAGAGGVAAGGTSAFNIGNLGNIMGGIGSMGSLLGNASSQGSSDKTSKKAYQAYQAYLQAIADKMATELEARAEKYDTKLQNQFNEAEPQYQQEAYTQLPEVQQLVEDIANQSAEAQRQNQRQINASLAQQGVRGGQAAILANRATGELNRDLQRDINKTVYDEAANRQNSRLNYYAQKALTPWSAMSNAYGQSMVGANNALSYAQGNVYRDAYGRMSGNYINTQGDNGSRLNNAMSGATTGAAAGSILGGPWGALGGGLIGGVAGYMKKK